MKPLQALFMLALSGLAACGPSEKKTVADSGFELMVLGVAQDGGYPQAGCNKDCCRAYESGKETERFPACLALYDKKNQKVLFLEATPAYPEQWRNWKKEHSDYPGTHPDAFFITHAHMGHYTGLMHLGREVMGTQHVPVYVLPRLFAFLENNGPWSQLVTLQNIQLNRLIADSAIQFNPEISVLPWSVPHRDEFSETAGFQINAGGKRILFIPDIDKWHLWSRDIKQEIKSSDLVFLDATFYKNGELKRDMSEIPHPFVEESLALFASLPEEEKNKIHFIHFNHTNPLIWDKTAIQTVEKRGYHVAIQGETFHW